MRSCPALVRLLGSSSSLVSHLVRAPREEGYADCCSFASCPDQHLQQAGLPDHLTRKVRTRSRLAHPYAVSQDLDTNLVFITGRLPITSSAV